MNDSRTPDNDLFLDFPIVFSDKPPASVNGLNAPAWQRVLPLGSRPIAEVYTAARAVEWLIRPARGAGQFLDNKVVHVKAHLVGKHIFRPSDHGFNRLLKYYLATIFKNSRPHRTVYSRFFDASKG